MDKIDVIFGIIGILIIAPFYIIAHIHIKRNGPTKYQDDFLGH